MSQRWLQSALGESVLSVDASNGSEQVTLPNGFAPGRSVIVRRSDYSSNSVTVYAAGGDSINGRVGGNRTVAQMGEARFLSTDPGQWFTTAEEPGNFTIPALEAVPLTVYGDSYGQGTQGADQASRPFNRISVRHKTQTATIRAVAGTRMDQIAAAVASSWGSNGRGLVGFSDGCINDILQYVDDVGRFTTREAWRTCLAYLTAWSIASIPSTSIVFGPGWASGVSSTAGSYADVAWSASATHLLLGFVTGSGGTFTVTDTTGAIIATVNTGGYKQNFTGAVRLPGVAGQAKTVRVTLTSGSGSILGQAVSSPTPPLIAWDKASRFNGSSVTATRLALYYTECTSILGDYPSVIQCDMGSGWNYVTMISEDATHRNDLGNRFATDRVETELAAVLANDFRQGLNRLTAAAGTSAYTAPTPSFTSPGATAPAQVTGVSATAGSVLDVSWSAPADGGSTLTGYVLRYRVTGSPTWIDFPSSIPATSTSQSLSDVATSTSHEVQVAAVNSVGTGSYSATATGTSAAAIVTYAADTFNRADGTLGTTDTGNFTWSVSGGTAAIASNVATIFASAAGAGMSCLVNDSQADGTISATLPPGSGNAGVYARATTTTGYLFWNNSGTYTLTKRTGSTAYSALGTLVGTTPASNDRISLVCNGTSISARVNGVTKLTVTDATYASGSVGLWTQRTSAAPSTLDDFAHTSSTAV